MTWRYDSLLLRQSEAESLLDCLFEGYADAGVACWEHGPDAWRVSLYCETDLDLAQLAKTASQCLQAPVTFAKQYLAKEDWVAKSLALLKPVVAGRFIVHGAHDRGIIARDKIAIELEAGQAFGSGHHETTAGCLMALDSLCQRQSFHNALDLGTGSGVLAIALAKAQDCRVLASDSDRVAVMSAGANAAANGVGTVLDTVWATGFDAPVFAERAPFDLIMANILASPLIELSPQIVRHCAEGGSVVLSGLLTGQAEGVKEAYLDLGLVLCETICLKDWATLILARPPVSL